MKKAKPMDVAWREGYDAHSRYESLDTNPFDSKKNPRLRQWWYHGWWHRETTIGIGLSDSKTLRS
jgi:hypothetical protein